jgi:hypothetical protein
MIRSLALTVSFSLAVAGLALAQTHQPSHSQGRPPHDSSDHAAVDPGQHAAMHALVHGYWTGASISRAGVSQKLDLIVANDKLGNLTLQMTTDERVRVGSAKHVNIEGSTLTWTQDYSGAPCNATAVVSPATKLVPETMKGTMACQQGEITFALQKTKG